MASMSFMWLVFGALLVVTDDERVAPPGHATDPNWVGGIVPPVLLDLFTPMEYTVKDGRFAGEVFKYRLFQPKNVGPEKRYPLLVWSSGYGEMGDDNFAQLRHLQYIFYDQKSGERAAFYCLVMQVPEKYEGWIEPTEPPDDVAEVMMSLVDDVQQRFPIDRDRIYLSGVSAGGSVCWELLQRHPDKFAAVAPLAGGGGGENQLRLSAATKVPVWAFHTTRDPLTSIVPVRRTVQLLDNLGGIAHLSEIESDYHDCWTAAFTDYRLMDWLLTQRRGRTCWLRPGWTPIKPWELCVLVVVPLLIIAAVVSEMRRRRVLAASSMPVSSANLLSFLALLAVTIGCEPPPPGRSEPYATKLYVRGGFYTVDSLQANDKLAEDKSADDASWDICDQRNQLHYASKDRYEVTIQLAAGSHEFKIADRTWHAINLGGWPNAAEMNLETPYGLLLSEGSSNLVITVPVADRYRFSLFTNNRQKPLLIVEPAHSD
jgi:dienelactone hydrolase